jgi:SPP1 gp7 family putative phage head morphogenesis protein
MIKLPTIAAQLQRPRRRPKPRALLRPLRYPHGPEQVYERELHAYSELAARGVRTLVLPALGKLERSAGRALPRADAITSDLKGLIAELRDRFGVSYKEARSTALGMLDATSQVHADEFVRAYDSALSINPMAGNETWLPEAMRLGTEQNVGLIRSIPERMFDDVERIVSTSVSTGRRHEDVARELQERFGVTDRRATLIARDQTAKWTGTLNRHRQLDAGVEQFDWMAAGDERVRPDHRQRDGKRYAWATAEKIPGVTDVQCRCQGIPVIADWEEG